jgi:dihydrofolate synthase / folylpolyglutamate synthase
MKVIGIKTKLFSPGQNLISFIQDEVKELPERSVLVVTSKIVALAENRMVEINSEEDREKIIKEESEIAIRHPYGWLAIVDGNMTGSAGLDHSNVPEKNFEIMLPKDCYASAQSLCDELKKIYKLKDLGVLVTDSRLMPVRRGTLGAAFGYAGIKGLKEYIGTPDLFGRIYQRQKMNIPDALATAAVLEMGEGKEQKPLALIKDLTIEFTNEAIEKNELQIPANEDIYKHFYQGLDS